VECQYRYAMCTHKSTHQKNTSWPCFSLGKFLRVGTSIPFCIPSMTLPGCFSSIFHSLLASSTCLGSENRWKNANADITLMFSAFPGAIPGRLIRGLVSSIPMMSRIKNWIPVVSLSLNSCQPSSIHSESCHTLTAKKVGTSQSRKRLLTRIALYSDYLILGPPI
jgi:hypothetical protein